MNSLQKIDVTSLDELASLKEKIATYNDSVGTFLEASFKEAPLTDVLKISLDASYHPELNFHSRRAIKTQRDCFLLS